MPKKSTAPKKRTGKPRTVEPLNETARWWFRSLHPDAQVVVLQSIAMLKKWQMGGHPLPVEVLYATPEQRQAAHKTDAEHKAEARASEVRERKRARIREQWNAIHNRAQARKAKRMSHYLTPAEHRRIERLDRQLKQLDAVLS